MGSLKNKMEKEKHLAGHLSTQRPKGQVFEHHLGGGLSMQVPVKDHC